jgi:hypothetical protein
LMLGIQFKEDTKSNKMESPLGNRGIAHRHQLHQQHGNAGQTIPLRRKRST